MNKYAIKITFDESIPEMCKGFPCFRPQLHQSPTLPSKILPLLTKQPPIKYFFFLIFLNLSNDVVFYLSIYGWCLTSGSVWCFFSTRNAGPGTRKYQCKLTPVIIHKARSQIKHTQHLSSRSRQPEDAVWVRQFRRQGFIETSVLQVKHIVFVACL